MGFGEKNLRGHEGPQRGRGNVASCLTLWLGVLAGLLPLVAVAQTAMSDEEVQAIASLLGALILLSVYFAPTLVACVRGKKNIKFIFLINHFLGWTLVGWAVAFLWAFFRDREEIAQEVKEVFQQEGIRKNFRSLKSPWYFWYTGNYQVAVKAWLSSALIGAILLVVIPAIISGEALWQIFSTVMVGFVLEISLLGLMLLLLLIYLMIPGWIPDWLVEIVSGMMMNLVIPMAIGAVLGLIVGRLLATYYFSKGQGLSSKNGGKDLSEG